MQVFLLMIFVIRLFNLNKVQAANCPARTNPQIDLMDAEFKRNEIIPDVIDSSPGNLLNVSWNEKIAHFGNELKPQDVT